MLIRLGPAGVPISSKERSSAGGVRRCAELGLQAMEIEFVRGVRMSVAAACELGGIAKQFDVELSVHGPYFVNLTSAEPAKVAASERMILDSAERGAAMGASIALVHAGYYGKLDSTACTQAMLEKFAKLREVCDRNGWNILLGIETTGRLSQWGTIDEILRVCNAVPGTAPCIDWAHIFARQGGKIDYAEILDKVKRFRHLHCHFSGINYNIVEPGKGNERSHVPMTKGPPQFEPLAKEILKRRLDVTIIAESPVLEQDSLVMRKIFEKLGYRFEPAGLKRFVKHLYIATYI